MKLKVKDLKSIISEQQNEPDQPKDDFKKLTDDIFKIVEKFTNDLIKSHVSPQEFENYMGELTSFLEGLKKINFSKVKFLHDRGKAKRKAAGMEPPS